jgi:glutaredoxin
VIDVTKTCRHCSKTKPITEFVRRRLSADGYEHRCLACKRAHSYHERQRIARNKRGTIDLPVFRPDKVYKGKPGKVLKRVRTEGVQW